MSKKATMTILNEPLAKAIQRLRSQRTDDADYEAKACAHGLSASVWDTVSSFANSFGGILLLGLDESSGFAPAQGFDINKVRDQFVEGMGDGGSDGIRLTNPPTYRMRRETVDGRQILVVTIFANDIGKKPCYVTAKGVENGSYKRVDDKDIRLSSAEIYEYRHQLTPSYADMEVVPGCDATDLDDQQLRLIFAAKKNSRALYGAKTKQQKLARLDITDKKGEVLLGGLLATGQFPQQFFPRLIIDVAAHPGDTKSEPGKLRFLDRAQCDGPIPVMLDTALQAVRRNLRTYSFVQGIGRTDELEIPEEVLREVLANAVVHREYHQYFRGQPVSVDIYPNRVEVSNPGGLWGGATTENLADGTSRCRNAALIVLVRDAPIPGEGTATTVEGQGSGIPFVLRQLEQRGLPKPTFRATADQFTVILWRADPALPPLLLGYSGPSGQSASAGSADLSVSSSSADPAASSASSVSTAHTSQEPHAGSSPTSKPSGNPRIFKARTAHKARTNGRGPASQVKEETLAAIYEAMPSGAAITARELAQRTRKSSKTVQRALKTLIAAGQVQAIGKPKSRTRAYIKTER
ncbi:putative DNA binding domain-containing protein [Bifidobacterium sp. ESL0690]|uniref:ATP-binding protein n=1 Tax=Bifidobacterium sp. ESL0690 TaxID=2983214 RepID=UPI0023F8CCF8|nr:ATP-binding protein [Bifidobacterium sp. ESL0690]WEV46731.1 putative DNA binding domain-containing protein [Bifidobacterium sp. ESL0690]